LSLSKRSRVSTKPLLSFFIFLLLLPAASVLQAAKSYTAQRTETAPRIDGRLDEAVWKLAPSSGDLTQLQPRNGEKPFQKSDIRILYDQKGIYVGAMLYDTAPDSIDRREGTRDTFGNGDYFGIYLDPYGDHLTAYGFFLSSAGTQVDMRATISGGEDASWDAVWLSEAVISDSGWCAGMSIPWSSLRFPPGNDRVWSMNMFRGITRYNTNNSWEPIPNDVPNWLAYFGELQGLNDLDPPLRLSFLPYISASWDHSVSATSYGYKGGMDMKYGISDNATLDMMLIPDFSQVQSDDKTLNLSPFELYYNERRPFFTEGGDLFGKANIFYSRRIGAQPAGFWSVNDSLTDHERISDNPSSAPIYNATKITGKTKSGLAYGTLYALTGQTEAVLIDTLSGEERRILTQSPAHFNVTVLDRSLGKNSYLSLINTHTRRPGDDFSANVSGMEFRLSDRQERYAFSGTLAGSARMPRGEESEKGFKSSVSLERTGQALRYDIWQWIESDTYNPNDLGYLQASNESGLGLGMHYNIHEARGRMQNLDADAELYILGLYKPFIHTGSALDLELDIGLTNHAFTGGSIESDLSDRMDYHEPRVDGRKFRRKAGGSFDIWYASNDTKKLGFVLVLAWGGRYGDPQGGSFFLFEPRIRLSDSFSLRLTSTYNPEKNVLGFAEIISEPDSILFGRRNRQTVENMLNAEYIFSPRSKISVRARHYRSSAEYTEYGLLHTDGTVGPYSGNRSVENTNYNAFSADINFIWNFSPGSELSVTWKQDLSHSDTDIRSDYFENLRSAFELDQRQNLIVKVLWYIDAGQILRL